MHGTFIWVITGKQGHLCILIIGFSFKNWKNEFIQISLLIQLHKIDENYSAFEQQCTPSNIKYQTSKHVLLLHITMYYYYVAVTCHKILRHMLKINSFSHWTILAHLIHRLIPLWKILMYVLLFSYIYQQYHQIFSCSMLKLLNTFSLSNGEVWTLLFKIYLFMYVFGSIRFQMHHVGSFVMPYGFLVVALSFSCSVACGILTPQPGV